MRLSRRNDSPILSAGDLVLDTRCRSLSGPKGSVKLDAGTYVVLREFMARVGDVLTMSALISAVWPDPALEPEIGAERSIKQRIYRSRQALAEVGVSPRRLVTQRTEGYGLLAPHTVGRAFAPGDAAAFDRIVAVRPDLSALAAELEADAAQRAQIAA